MCLGIHRRSMLGEARLAGELRCSGGRQSRGSNRTCEFRIDALAIINLATDERITDIVRMISQLFQVAVATA